jgi:MFS family permease
MRGVTSPRQVHVAAPCRWLTRGVLGIGLASLFSDWGHEIATPLLPVLLAGLGAPAYALGVIEGVADGLSSVAKLFGGWLADRPALRKPLAVAGYLVTGLSTFAFGFVARWPEVLAARSVGWMGRGIRGPSRDVLLTDAVAPARLGSAFGFERAMDTLGAVLGPLTAMVLVGAAGVMPAMRWSLLPGAAAALTIALLVRGGGHAAGHQSGTHPGFVQSLRTVPTRFARFLAGVLLFGLGDFAPTLLILRAATVLGLRQGQTRGATYAVALYTVHNACYALACFPAGALGDRKSKRALLAASYFLAAGTFAGFLFAPASFVGFAGLFALAGVSVAAHETLEKSFGAQILTAERRGTGFGLLATTAGVGDLVSSLVVGALWSAVSPAAGFGYAAVLCGAGAFLILFV